MPNRQRAIWFQTIGLQSTVSRLSSSIARRVLMPVCVLWMLLLPGLSHALVGLPDFTTLVEESHMAVVNISTSMSARYGSPDSDSDSTPDDLEDSPHGDLLRRFFDDQLPPPGASPESSSLGSGFIISADGYVMTNNHVIADADEIIVRLHDRRQLVAKVVGTDPRSDIALLKVDAEDLPVVKIGESDALKVGEWVLAIGSPFGFDFSVTAGIVSAKGRALPRESYVPFIQTDVAINPGNSGGPLFNLDGEVIGVNSQIYSRTGGFMGLSFAIPIELAIDVTEQLRSDGRVSRGWLGVVIQEMTRELAESFGMSRAHGALVQRVLPNSPAEDADIQVGDVITHFNGLRIERSSGLPPLVGRVRINTAADVEIIRDGEPVTLSVTIGELPSNDEINRVASARRPSDGDNPLNIKVGEASEELLGELEVEHGILVQEVINGGPADKAGVLPGDVLLMVHREEMNSLEDFDRVIEGLGDDDKSIAVLIQRPGGSQFLALKLDER